VSLVKLVIPLVKCFFYKVLELRVFLMVVVITASPIYYNFNYPTILSKDS